MKKWLSKDAEEQYIEEGSYTYRLVGVVVHRGGADAGHYYSFIQDRITGVWNKFDDKSVEPFNIHVCFVRGLHSDLNRTSSKRLLELLHLNNITITLTGRIRIKVMTRAPIFWYTSK